MKTKMLGSFLIAAGLTTATLLADGPRTYQTTNTFQAGMPAIKKPGAATLVRSKQGVEVRVATSGLDMQTSYTVWWVIFNNPAACTHPNAILGVSCGGPDLPNPAVQAAVIYAAGFVTGLGDSGNISAHLEAGSVPAGADVTPDGTASQLNPGNGFGAEIHVVVRSHGPTTPGSVDQQVGSFNGGCQPVPNVSCANKQAAVFPPVQ